MTRNEIPTLVLVFTICNYWYYVAKMIRRVTNGSGDIDRVIIPSQRREQYMWMIWVPLIFSWMVVPLISALYQPARDSLWIGLPEFARATPYFIVRCLAALLGLTCLALSIRCWRHMGQDWRMGIDEAQQSKLIVDGPFSRVRHPIYALSITLMSCSLAVLPSPVMAIIAVTHITLMQLKARNEERFLLERHGEAYARYCARTSRFVPFVRSGGGAS